MMTRVGDVYLAGRRNADVTGLSEGVARSDVAHEYQRAVEINPRYFFACRNLARCLERLGRFADAVKELERGAAAFVACEDLHPSVARLRSECRARYLRILNRFRTVGFDFRRFAEEYWSEVRERAAR